MTCLQLMQFKIDHDLSEKTEHPQQELNMLYILMNICTYSARFKLYSYNTKQPQHNKAIPIIIENTTTVPNTTTLSNKALLPYSQQCPIVSGDITCKATSEI